MNLLLDPNVAYVILVIGFVLGVLALFTPGTGFLEIGVLFAIVLAGYGSVLLHSGADAYIVVSVGSFVTGVVFTLLGIRYRRYKTLHRPFSPDAADKASSQSLSDDQ